MHLVVGTICEREKLVEVGGDRRCRREAANFWTPQAFKLPNPVKRLLATHLQFTKTEPHLQRTCCGDSDENARHRHKSTRDRWNRTAKMTGEQGHRLYVKYVAPSPSAPIPPNPLAATELVDG